MVTGIVMELFRKSSNNLNNLKQILFNTGMRRSRRSNDKNYREKLYLDRRNKDKD
jgi:hypothetical protein